jgi:methyltransferase
LPLSAPPQAAVAIAVLVFTTVQRLGELVYARANTRWLLAHGGREAGAGHYPFMVAMHAAWLIGLWGLVLWRQPAVNYLWLGVFVVCQLLRVWVLATLGRRWTTRIIVVPGETLVAKGPYRFIPHPNYAVVVVEIAAVPLTLGFVWFAALFSVLNALMLWVRIREERAALDDAVAARSN